ncbi:hypothetical protein NQZ68_016342 [Dissostichus eleginoides]|nr:hypothetical protein NQZ68_016342 [Dissostichus eleginoides]
MDSLLSPLSPFLALPGEPPIPWVRWLESFETFIVAAELADANDDRKKALLIHTLESEGQWIFRTLGPAPKYEDCVTLLTGHFAAPQNVMLLRIIFRQLRQQAGESVHHYVADHRTRVELQTALPRDRGVNAVAGRTISYGPPPRTPGPHAPTTIHSVAATSRPLKCCTVELDGVCLPLLLDTGASKSLLNVSKVRRLFPLRTLTANAEDLYRYGHSKIGMAGTITFAVP